MTKEKEAALSGNRAMSQERQQLDKAQHGLEAAAMLSEQLDKKSSVISHMKQEISVREEMVKSLQAKMINKNQEAGDPLRTH